MDYSYPIKSWSMGIGVGIGLSLKTNGVLYALKLDVSHHLIVMVVFGEHGKCLVSSLPLGVEEGSLTKYMFLYNGSCVFM
jgi:hypothetical protein